MNPLTARLLALSTAVIAAATALVLASLSGCSGATADRAENATAAHPRVDGRAPDARPHEPPREEGLHPAWEDAAT